MGALKGGANGAVGTGGLASAAADALRAVGHGLHRDVHGAGLLAGAAPGALLGVNPEAVEGHGVKESVDSPQGAEVAAEGAVDHHGEEEEHHQDGHLPAEQPAQGELESGVGGHQGNSGEEGARRADILAEPGLSLAHNVQHRKWEDNDKPNQNDVLQEPEPSVSGQPAQLFDKGDFMQQVLDQPEGAQPSAHKPAQQCAEEEKKAGHIESELVVPAGDDGLKRTDWAGAQCARTGVAVETGDAEQLAAALVDSALGETGGVTVRQGGEADLDPGA